MFAWRYWAPKLDTNDALYLDIAFGIMPKFACFFVLAIIQTFSTTI